MLEKSGLLFNFLKMNPYSPFHTVKQENAPLELKLIVEIAEGDNNKYEYNKEIGILELDRVLYGPTYYPVNYCDVPNTWNNGDNDPLDAVLFSSSPIAPGVLATGRVIGVMEMEDNGEVDHKIVCVNKKDPRFDHVKTVDDLTPYQKKDLKTFMDIYKIAQTGPGTVKVGEFLGPEAAAKIINEALEEYKKKFST